MKRRVALARVDNEERKRKVGIARSIIYEKNYAVNCEAVEKLLKQESLVPTSVSSERSTRINSSTWFRQNAFSARLSQFGFNFHSLFVVDLMHEFELGVWKALFIHLLRILNAADTSLVDELDYR